MNNVNLVGRLAKDPIARDRGDTRITELTLVTERPRIRDGKVEKDPETGYPLKDAEFHKITIFNGKGMGVRSHKVKGDLLAVTRNNRGVAHENGSIESRHGHVKVRIDQALMLRGSYDFTTLDAYRAFVAGVIAEHNRRHADAIEIERAHLRALPPSAPSTWEEASVRVTSSSGFSFRHAFYTVPSRLIGHRLHLRVHDDRIDAYLGAAHMLTLPRGRAPAKTAGRTTTHIVDYRTSSARCAPSPVRWQA